MVNKESLNVSGPRQKAFELNLEKKTYGSIAEIGAGQEVARHFFQAGGASGTVAKTMSAYDMQVSNAIYGSDESGRYVTCSRLESMLDKEYAEVLEYVAKAHPDSARKYFAFADTVAAKRYKSNKECHGWMGIQFQHEPGAAPSRMVLHIRMLDNSNLAQQEALGILGVNLIHSAFRYHQQPEQLIDTLSENLDWGRIEIDYIQLSGCCFHNIDNRKMNLRLVISSQGPVVMFSANGKGEMPADLIYQKEVLILRGVFRPFTLVHQEMIRKGQEAFAAELGVPLERIAFFCEVNIARYLSDKVDEISDLLERVEMLTELGYPVMVTSHLRYFRLSEYFSKYEKKRKIGFILSVDNLYALFDDRYYEGMEGGILQAMAALFASDSKLLVYPNLTPEGKVVSVESLELPQHLHYLYQHLVHNRRMIPLQQDINQLVPFSQEAFIDRIARGDRDWESAVPESVRRRILGKIARQLAGP